MAEKYGLERRTWGRPICRRADTECCNAPVRDADKATESWLPQAVDVASKRGFEQVDLDNLLAGEPEMAVQVALACLRTASEYLAENGAIGLRAFVVVPLACAEELDLSAPDVPTLLPNPWKFGLGHSVPGLYVARPANLHWDQVDEAYRRRLHAPSAELCVEYRTWRAVETANAGWAEYERAVYFWRNA